ERNGGVLAACTGRRGRGVGGWRMGARRGSGTVRAGKADQAAVAGMSPPRRGASPAAFLASCGVMHAGHGGLATGGVTGAEQVREMRRSLGRELAARRRGA